ncbi:MAG: flippase [Ilumatobacteraceae bacterium]
MTTEESSDLVPSDDGQVSSQIRGSSVLLAGRVSSLFVTLLVQAVIARALSKTEFGQFSYALSLVTTVATFITLGIDRAVPRFLAMYDERKQWGHAAGTLVIQLSTILSLGLFAIVGVLGLNSWIADVAIDDRAVTTLLMIMIFLAPIQALDSLAEALFAVYAKPSAIFVRRYLMEPAMRLVLVLLLLLTDGGPRFLAFGYVITGFVGVVVYLLLLWPMVRDQQMIANVRSTGMTMPWRVVLSYSIPLMASDLLFAVLNTSDVVLIRRYRSDEAVAAYRVVLPAAKLNQFVMTSFALLFVPMVSRLLERNDRKGMSDLYWRTAAWIAVATFPVFALTFAMGDDVSAAMFGEQYRSSGTYLSLLSLGYYFNAALGFNGLTVKTAGRVAYTIWISLIAVVMNIGLNLLLIPDHGALGAAIATLVTLLAHNVLKQLGLRLGTGVPMYPANMVTPYVVIVVASAFLYAFMHIVQPGLVIGFVLATVVSLIVLRATRNHVRVLESFPELAKVPFASTLLKTSS